jgi:hypothetical protein
VDAGAARELRAAGIKYAPMFTFVRKDALWQGRQLAPEDAAKLRDWSRGPRYAGPVPAHVAALPPEERRRWGLEVGRRMRDEIRAAGGAADAWQLDEISPAFAGPHGAALREFAAGVLEGLAHGRPALGDEKMPGMVYFANSALKLAGAPADAETARFWKALDDATFRVIGEEYPAMAPGPGGSPEAGGRAAADREHAIGEARFERAGGVRAALARKYMPGLTPGYRLTSPDLGGDIGAKPAAWVDRWREAYIRERLHDGAPGGIAEFNWLPANDRGGVMDETLREIGRELRRPHP